MSKQVFNDRVRAVSATFAHKEPQAFVRMLADADRLMEATRTEGRHGYRVHLGRHSSRFVPS